MRVIHVGLIRAHKIQMRCHENLTSGINLFNAIVNFCLLNPDSQFKRLWTAGFFFPEEKSEISFSEFSAPSWGLEGCWKAVNAALFRVQLLYSKAMSGFAMLNYFPFCQGEFAIESGRNHVLFFCKMIWCFFFLKLFPYVMFHEHWLSLWLTFNLFFDYIFTRKTKRY